MSMTCPCHVHLGTRNTSNAGLAQLVQQHPGRKLVTRAPPNAGIRLHPALALLELKN